MRTLITAGGTREPIDRVRAITNTSTGATGTALAAELAALGHSVELLRSASATADLTAFLKNNPDDVPPINGRAPRTGSPIKELLPPFTTTADLEAALRERLARGDIDAVIMAAAVADYRPATREPGKLDSAHDTLTLRLVRMPKLLPQLRKMSPRPLRVIGFKLTVGASEAARHAAVAAQFASGAVDAVVHNDLLEIEAARTHGKPHPFRFYTAAPTLSTPNVANDARGTTPRKKNEAMPPLLLGTAALAAAINAFLHGQ